MLNRLIFSSAFCSKLTRESGTDFPIPALSGAPDDTEKLIREKDEEVRHAQRMAERTAQHTAECTAEAPQHCSECAPGLPQPPGGICYEKGDESL